MRQPPTSRPRAPAGSATGSDGAQPMMPGWPPVSCAQPGPADAEHVHDDHVAGLGADDHERAAQQDAAAGTAAGALHPDGAAGDDLRDARQVGVPVVVAGHVPAAGVVEVEHGG
ncbi:hypothetical protein [Actinomadura madurae]|uniref:hypothetical protein n=1 Tax=Actinomadura madurae TaxID=1993 RepID=UPI0020D20A37|nr:hypothetical protein [Actinomadura madurae]MCQ0019822.1 hypothetical protein [Actinomadura madurae]